MNKVESIMKIAQNVDNSDKIILFSKSFKVVGTIVKESDMISKGILTLRNATVCNSLENFECSFSHHVYKWLNIFEDEIIAFSITNESFFESIEED